MTKPVSTSPPEEPDENEEVGIPDHRQALFDDLWDSLHPHHSTAEDLANFNELVAGIVEALNPKDEIDWQYCVDFVDATFELLDLRGIKHAMRAEARGSAVEALLRRQAAKKGCEGKILTVMTNQSFAEWRNHPEKRGSIEAGLARYSRDAEHAITVEAFEQRRVSIEYVEKLIASAQHRRGMLLREYHGRREVLRRAEEVAGRFMEEKLKSLPPPDKGTENK